MAQAIFDEDPKIGLLFVWKQRRERQQLHNYALNAGFADRSCAGVHYLKVESSFAASSLSAKFSLIATAFSSWTRASIGWSVAFKAYP